MLVDSTAGTTSAPACDPSCASTTLSSSFHSTDCSGDPGPVLGLSFLLIKSVMITSLYTGPSPRQEWDYTKLRNISIKHAAAVLRLFKAFNQEQFSVQHMHIWNILNLPWQSNIDVMQQNDQHQDQIDWTAENEAEFVEIWENILHSSAQCCVTNHADKVRRLFYLGADISWE